MKLFLVRNAETQWSKEKRLHGRQDSPLTALGKEQAKELAELLKGESFDVAYCSDLGRAIDTAKPIVSHHKDLKLQTRTELRERSHGIAEGLTQKEVFDEYPALQKERLKNKYAFRNPKGESYSDAEQKLKSFAEELKQKHFSHSVLIVAHAPINRILIGLFAQLPPEKVLSIDQPVNCVYVIENADSNPIVSRLSSIGKPDQVEGLLFRDHLKKPSFEEEENESIEIEDDWA